MDERYIPGDPWVIDDLSGFKIRRSQSVKLYNGLIVDRATAGEETQRHPQELVRGRPERYRVRDARPEQPMRFLEVGEVTAEDL